MRFTQQSAFLVAVLAGSTFAAPMPRGVGGAFKGIEKVGDVADAANNAASQNPDVVQDAEAKAKGFFHKIHLRDLDTREPRRSKFETVEKVGSAVNTGGNFASGIENMYDEVHQQRDLDTRAPKGKSVEKIQKAAGVANAAHNVDGAEPDAAPMNEDPFSADFLTKRDIIADVKAEVSKLTQRGLESEAR